MMSTNNFSLKLVIVKTEHVIRNTYTFICDYMPVLFVSVAAVIV